MNDTWEISINNLRNWRWRRISPTGEVVGASPRGYKNKADCEANAQYNGRGTMDTVEQDVVDKLSQKTSEPNVEADSPSLVSSINEPEVDHNSEKAGCVSKFFIQQNLIRLIAIFLGLMLVVLILILFKNDPEPGLSDNNLSNSRMLFETVVTS